MNNIKNMLLIKAPGDFMKSILILAITSLSLCIQSSMANSIAKEEANLNSTNQEYIDEKDTHFDYLDQKYTDEVFHSCWTRSYQKNSYLEIITILCFNDSESEFFKYSINTGSQETTLLASDSLEVIISVIPQIVVHDDQESNLEYFISLPGGLNKKSKQDRKTEFATTRKFKIIDENNLELQGTSSETAYFERISYESVEDILRILKAGI